MKRPDYLNQIRGNIERAEAGSVFVSTDFTDITDKKTVNMGLIRLADEGLIKKILFGVYYKPEFSELLGEAVAPSPKVYAAATEEIALAELDSFDEKWSGKYPKIAKSWRDNWANLSTYFKYPEAVRRLIYTTNAIEGFNRQLRKVTKSRTVFPSDDSLLKMLYLAMMDITKKWTGHRQDWGQIHSQLEIFFEERLSGL